MLDLEVLELLQSFLSEEFLAQFGEGLLLKKKMGLLGIFLSGLIGCLPIHFEWPVIKKFHLLIQLLTSPQYCGQPTIASHNQTLFIAGLSSP